MPVWRIDRTFDNWSEDDLGAGKLRAQMCALHFSGMRWITSYVAPDLTNSVCFYEAESADDIWAHGEEAKLPIDAVTEVRVVTPDDPAE